MRKPVPGLFSKDKALLNTMDQAGYFMKEMFWIYRVEFKVWEAMGFDLKRCSVERFHAWCMDINCELEQIGFNLAGSRWR